ncbi:MULTISPECIES: response regulator [Chitinophaga]|uniref:response regulator n=1 Tax=Chitinophaga TaxID=79328 RepID=UPI0021D34FFD|nr:response regulator [Chitinophaga varians]
MVSSCKYSSVLLIDDDVDDRMIFGDVLKELVPDIIYNEAINGEDALVRLEEGLVPDLIFLDLNMPRVDGKQFLAELRQIEHLRHIPVIIYTTSSHESDKKETRALGASYFITKPNSLHELSQLLKGILEQTIQYSL